MVCTFHDVEYTFHDVEYTYHVVECRIMSPDFSLSVDSSRFGSEVGMARKKAWHSFWGGCHAVIMSKRSHWKHGLSDIPSDTAIMKYITKICFKLTKKIKQKMKTTKLSMLMLGILLAMPLSFTSCSDDDDDQGGGYVR